MSLSKPTAILPPGLVDEQRYQLTMIEAATGKTRKLTIGGPSLIAARIADWLRYPPTEWSVLSVQRVSEGRPADPSTGETAGPLN